LAASIPIADAFIESSGTPPPHESDPDPFVFVAPAAITHTSPARDRYRLAIGRLSDP
jgi:hypothetical protein